MFFKFRNNHPDFTGYNSNEKLFYINKIKCQFFRKGRQVNDFFKCSKSFTKFDKNFEMNYSYRKASIGFSLPAFNAGYKPASRPTIVQMIILP